MTKPTTKTAKDGRNIKSPKKRSGKKSIPESRVDRLLQLGGLAARVAGGVASAVGSGLAVGRDIALARLHEETAAKLLETMSDMKGLPMKLGQIISFMDGVIPPEVQPIYRKTLAKLQVKSKPVPWPDMEQELITALGCPLNDLFREFSPEPIAAASIGQVYLAQTKAGEKVAVKVQYPGIRVAMQSDLKNINAVLSTLTNAIPRLDVGKMAQDFLMRVSDECDYVQEARNQQEFHEIWKNDPVVIVPKVFHELSRKNVLVTEFCEGMSFRELVDKRSRQLKNDAGATLYRFVMHSIDVHGLFNADPHPGNFLFRDDSRVVFIDFGCVQRYDEAARKSMLAARRAALDGLRDADLWPYLADIMQFRKEVPLSTQKILTEYLSFCMEPVLARQPYRFTPEYTARISELTMKMKLDITKNLLRDGWSEPRRDGLVHMGRIVFGLYSLLAEIRAENNWLTLLA